MKKLLIQGLGKWGEILVKSLAKSKVAKFTTVVSRNPTSIKSLCHKYKLKSFKSVREAIASEKVDGIVLCTPHSIHTKQIIEYSKFKKPIFVEKPLALKSSDAKKAILYTKKNNILLAVGQNRRFLNTFLYLKKIIKMGKLGNILHVEANFSGPSGFRHAKSGWRSNSKESPAGGMTGKGIHMTDLMISLLGEVKSVQARSKKQFLKNDMDDTTDIILEFKSGQTGYLSTITATADIWRFQVFGTKGWIELRDEHNLFIKMINEKSKSIKIKKINTEKIELETFVKAFKNHNKYPITLKEAYNNIKLLEKINLSIKQKKMLQII